MTDSSVEIEALSDNRFFFSLTFRLMDSDWTNLEQFAIRSDVLVWACKHLKVKLSDCLLPFFTVSSLGLGDLNMWHRYCINCIGYQYGSVFCPWRPCWCRSVGTVWLRLTCRHTAFQRHHMTVGVTFALPYLDNYLFHARRRTTVTAAAQLCC